MHVVVREKVRQHATALHFNVSAQAYDKTSLLVGEDHQRGWDRQRRLSVRVDGTADVSNGHQ
jgi:hypothetical protein